MEWLKENWFKFVFLGLGTYLVMTVPFDYVERQLWADERLKAFEVCVSYVAEDPTVFGSAGYGSYDAYIAAFRACKNVSDSF